MDFVSSFSVMILKLYYRNHNLKKKSSLLKILVIFISKMEPEFLNNFFFQFVFKFIFPSLPIFLILRWKSWCYRETEVKRHMAFYCCCGNYS